MDDDQLRELLRSPLDDPGPNGRGWLPWLAGLAVAAVAVGTVFVLLRGGDAEQPAPDPQAGGAPTTGTGPAVPPTTLPGVPAWPESGSHHQLVYDPATDRVILPGGYVFRPNLAAQPGPATDGTWAFAPDAAGWLAYPPAPDPVAGYAAARDGASGRIVLFGGTDTGLRLCGASGPCGATARDDTWLLDPATGEWEAADPELSPAPRYGAAMAYDEQSGVLVLFGGATLSGSSFQNDPLSDTWSYDVATDEWTELAPPSSPSARAWHRMAYDPGTDRILLFGGTGGDELDDRVWAYDVDANRWEPGAAGPAGRWTPIAAFDAESRMFVVVGGQGPVVRTIGESVTATEMQWRGDVWGYLPGSDEWRDLPDLGGAVPWASGAYHPGLDRIVAQLFDTTGLYDVDSGEWTWIEAPAG